VFRDELEDHAVIGAPGEDSGAGAAFYYRPSFTGWSGVQVLKQTNVGSVSNN